MQYKLGSKLNDLHNEALEQIRNLLQVGEICELMTAEEIEADDDGLAIYEMPMFGNIDKHSSYSEWAIVRIKKDNKGEVEVNGYGIGEDSGDERLVDIKELTVEEVIFLADFLVEFFNSKTGE